MCERPPAKATAEMGRSTDADGDGNVRCPSLRSLNFMLDSDRFIDATASRPNTRRGKANPWIQALMHAHQARKLPQAVR